MDARFCDSDHEAITDNHYVDDYLDSFASIEDAVKTVNEIMTIHDKANFVIRNFVSNSHELISSLPENRRANKEMHFIENKDDTYEKIFGMHWDTRNDTFRYKLKINHKHVTCRIKYKYNLLSK